MTCISKIKGIEQHLIVRQVAYGDKVFTFDFSRKQGVDYTFSKDTNRGPRVRFVEPGSQADALGVPVDSYIRRITVDGEEHDGITAFLFEF